MNTSPGPTTPAQCEADRSPRAHATTTSDAAHGPVRPILVLVHGAWHGAWCWERIAPRLREQGFAVHTPTLAGLGERANEPSAGITLETHIAEVGNYLASNDLNDVLLVGHSYGGVVVTGVADRMSHRMRGLVYLDALIFQDGESLASIAGPDRWQAMSRTAIGPDTPVALPSPPAEAFGLVDADDIAMVQRRLTPQPIHTFDQRLELAHPFGNGLRKAYIDCTDPSMDVVAPFKKRVRTQDGWNYQTLRAGHDAMLSAPEPLLALLVGLAS